MRTLHLAIGIQTAALALSGIAAVNPPVAKDASAPSATSMAWNPTTAAQYLDAREVWWQEWPHAQKDHGTVCVSCHTQVPYALARPALRSALGEQKVSAPERAMLDSILTRVNLGNEAETFYNDNSDGPGKTHEAVTDSRHARNRRCPE